MESVWTLKIPITEERDWGARRSLSLLGCSDRDWEVVGLAYADDHHWRNSLIIKESHFPRFTGCICLQSSGSSWTWSSNEELLAPAGTTNICIGVGPWDTALEGTFPRGQIQPP